MTTISMNFANRALVFSLSVALTCGAVIGAWLYSDRKRTFEECLASAQEWTLQYGSSGFLGCEALAREAALKQDARAYRFMALHSETLGDFTAARSHWETAIRLGDNPSNIKLIHLIMGNDTPSNCKRMREALAAYKADTDAQKIAKYEAASYVMSGSCPFSDEERREALGPSWKLSLPE